MYKNALTVILSQSDSDNLNMFFCPYTRSNVAQYHGLVSAIIPGYDKVQNPNVIIRPQKLAENLHYVFLNGKTKDITNFWIENNVLSNMVKPYFCFNCQAPLLYFSNDKVVNYHTKKEVKSGEELVCHNPNCKCKTTFMGKVDVELI